MTREGTSATVATSSTRKDDDMNDLTRMINARLDAGERNEREIAEAILAEIIGMENAIDILLPIICNAVGHQRRAVVRQLEDHAAPFRAKEPALTAASGEAYRNPAMEARTNLMAESAFVPGDGWIQWGLLTLEQHQKIVDFYERRIAGYQRTIQRHVEAIEVLEATGATCLNEVI
jgi:hypothetical protein